MMHLNNGRFAYDGFFRYSSVSLYNIWIMLQAINVIAAIPPTLSSRDQFLFEEEISLRSPPLGCSGKAYLRKDHSGGKMVHVKPGICIRDFRKETENSRISMSGEKIKKPHQKRSGCKTTLWCGQI